FMVGAGHDPRGVRGSHLRHGRRLPCSHASHPCAGELFSLSMIKASMGKYHRRGAPCTRPHTSWTGDGLPPQVCQGDSIVSSLGHRALEGVADLLIFHTITAFGGVGTFQCSKEPYRCVSCSNRPRRWRTNEGECWRRTRDETVRYFMVYFALMPSIAGSAHRRWRGRLVRKLNFVAQSRQEAVFRGDCA